MADKAKAEAEATKKSIGDILDKAQTTAKSQELSLAKTDTLQSGMERTWEQQQKNLKITDNIAKDMRESLTKQLSLLDQTKQISLNVDRSLFPIEPFTVSFTLSIPLTHPVIKNYAIYIDAQLRRLLPQLLVEKKNASSEIGGAPVEGLFLYDYNSQPFKSNIMIDGGSPHIPSYNTVEGKLLNRQIFIVEFYKPPFDLQAIKANRSFGPDMQLWVSAFAGDRNAGLDFVLRDEHLLLTAYSAKTNLRKRTERVSSLLDFSGTLLVVRFVGGLDKMFKLPKMRLQQPNGRCFNIDGSLFHRVDEFFLRPGEVLIDNNQPPPTVLFQKLDILKLSTDCG